MPAAFSSSTSSLLLRYAPPPSLLYPFPLSAGSLLCSRSAFHATTDWVPVFACRNVSGLSTRLPSEATPFPQVYNFPIPQVFNVFNNPSVNYGYTWLCEAGQAFNIVEGTCKAIATCATASRCSGSVPQSPPPPPEGVPIPPEGKTPSFAGVQILSREPSSVAPNANKQQPGMNKINFQTVRLFHLKTKNTITLELSSFLGNLCKSMKQVPQF